LVGSRGRWTQLTTADGLPSADVTDIIPDGDGAAWVATRGGLARITY
jgi:ligand-binding sensor domain-containing protein